jgi:hypothetical protein
MVTHGPSCVAEEHMSWLVPGDATYTYADIVPDDAPLTRDPRAPWAVGPIATIDGEQVPARVFNKYILDRVAANEQFDEQKSEYSTEYMNKELARSVICCKRPHLQMFHLPPYLLEQALAQAGHTVTGVEVNAIIIEWREYLKKFREKRDMQVDEGTPSAEMLVGWEDYNVRQALLRRLFEDRQITTTDQYDDLHREIHAKEVRLKEDLYANAEVEMHLENIEPPQDPAYVPSEKALEQVYTSRGGCAGTSSNGFVIVFLLGMGGIFRRRWF